MEPESLLDSAPLSVWPSVVARIAGEIPSQPFLEARSTWHLAADDNRSLRCRRTPVLGQRACHQEIARALAELGIVPSPLRPDGRTPLELAHLHSKPPALDRESAAEFGSAIARPRNSNPTLHLQQAKSAHRTTCQSPMQRLHYAYASSSQGS